MTTRIAITSPRRRSRRGLSLVEVLVVVAILIAIAAIAIPTISSFFVLEQRQFVKELALTYEALHDEAVLRNVTFRVGYHLDEGFYEVQVGSPDTFVFDDPQKRQDYEEQRADRMSLLTERELQEEQLNGEESEFQQLVDRFTTRRQVPRSAVFKGVYTPQYGEIVKPSGDPEKPVVVYSYVFANGFAEHTIVQIGDPDDEEDGWTVEIEPLSGRVHLSGELLGPDDSEREIPDEGPELN